MDKSYATLFNAITDAIRELEKIKAALISAQLQTEEWFIINEESSDLQASSHAAGKSSGEKFVS